MQNQFSAPSLVRIKPGALDRLGIYLTRAGFKRVRLVGSAGIDPDLAGRVERALTTEGVELAGRSEVAEASFERAVDEFATIGDAQGVVGFGGGKALDVAKYVAHLAGRPYLAVPTSLSNDGFCSPLASLTLKGRRRTLPARLPRGVVIDSDVCLAAPPPLWRSGVGDLVAKLTAIADWKLAARNGGEPVNDFAVLLSDATVRQFLSRPVRDRDGVRLLGTALMLNGIAMEVCGSSRPASGSEHLISHAFDVLSSRPRLHGLQVGLATYFMSRLQGDVHTETIAGLFDSTGFWDELRADPFPAGEWIEAVRAAPAQKERFETVLSHGAPAAEVERIMRTDPRVAGCFVG